MSSFGKIVGINLAVLLVYSIIIRVLSGSSTNGSDRSMGILLGSAIAVFFHLVLCLIIAVAEFLSGHRESGRRWLSAAVVVLLVGFSVCLGNAEL